MGRPLNKRFFGPAGAGYEIVCNAYFTGGAAASEPAYIVEQRSNSKYRVAEVTASASTALTTGAQYEIVTVGGADYTTIGAANNNVGTIFTATGTSAGGAGTAREREVCIIVDATPAAPGEMQVVITPENAVATRQATIAITGTGGTGTLLTAVIVDAGYGYWAAGTNVAIVGGPDGTVDYTVSNGALATVSVNGIGSANTDGTYDIATAPAANPPVSNARIINARQVKSFNGTTYDWPIVGTNDGPDITGMPQADIGA